MATSGPVYEEVEEQIGKITSEANPSYAVVQGKPQGHAAEAEHGDKKHRVFSCWFVVIGLVVIGVVACVSVAIAVWSLAMVNNTTTSAQEKSRILWIGWMK